MNWYTLSCHGSGDVQICGASIVPLDALEYEKIRVSEKLRYELRDFLVGAWTIQPTHVQISTSPLQDRNRLGQEVILSSKGLYQNDDMLVINFESEQDDLPDNLNMLVASKENRAFKREEILDITEWSEIKNFSLYCFLADLGTDLSVIV